MDDLWHEQAHDPFLELRRREPRFERHWFYVAASITAWVVFWNLADRHQENISSRLLAWGAVLAAFWVANNL